MLVNNRGAVSSRSRSNRCPGFNPASVQQTFEPHGCGNAPESTGLGVTVLAFCVTIHRDEVKVKNCVDRVLGEEEKSTYSQLMSCPQKRCAQGPARRGRAGCCWDPAPDRGESCNLCLKSNPWTCGSTRCSAGTVRILDHIAPATISCRLGSCSRLKGDSIRLLQANTPSTGCGIGRRD
jgi:hypothetical protein